METNNRKTNFFPFFFDVCRSYPRLIIRNTALLVAVSFFGAFSLFTISPVIDFFLHPDLQGVSPLTLKAIEVLKFFRLPVRLPYWLAIFLGFITLSSGFQVIARYFILKTKYVVLKDLICNTFEDFFNARWFFFSSRKQGMLINTLNRELNVVGNAFGHIGMLLASFLQIIFFLAVPLYISWQVTLISMGVALVLGIPISILGRIAYRLGLLTTKTSNEVNSVIQETLNLAKLTLGFSNQDVSLTNLENHYRVHSRAAIKAQIIALSILIFYRPFGVIMVIAAIYASNLFNVPLSEITVLIMALFQVALSLGNFNMMKNSIQNCMPSYEQIQRLRDSARAMKQPSGDLIFEGFNTQIKINDLSFAYTNDNLVLKDVNIVIPKGNMIAVVGKSGSGKSTFIDMIMRFHDPLKGSIVFDNVNLKEYDIRSLRKRIGYVAQDSVLFNMSIRDNLLWANPQATDEDIKNVCRLAYAEGFIDQCASGYDTIVGDRGVRLSGGQIQRLALARAFLRKPDLLILDEATSSLDTQSERLIQKAIENFAQKTTVIVVAHRLSTIKNADCIYVLDEGNIVEQGAYDTLVKNGSYFNMLAKYQGLELTV